MKITNIKTEYLINPIGIDIKSPRITWTDEGLKKQKAFEISYSINGGKIKTIKKETASMYYDFEEEFKSRDVIEYALKVFDENGEQSKYSSKNFFEMGLLDEKDWRAKWISGNYRASKKKRYPVDCFKKTFNVKDIKKARFYISAAGLYEASINGKKVGDFVLAPGSTDYRKRYQYQVYDVTQMLKEGDNTLTILLADGWYRGSIGAKGFTCVFGKQTKFIAQMEIYDKENKKTEVLSDSSFKWSNDGPILFADLKDGEIVDNRKTPSYSYNAIEVKNNAILTSSNNVFVVEKDVSKPINHFISPKGKIVFEYKNNIAGYISFKVSAKAGDVIKCRMGEMLDENGEVTLKNIQCLRKGKLSPLQEVTFICKDGVNEYHSKFFYGGFKYIEIVSSVEIDKNNFHQIAIYSDLEETSRFYCSNELINIFYQNTLRSLKSNSVDIPTDCPTRERMGWTGDSQLFFETASFLVDYSAFTRKHIVDVFDRQDKNGRLPQIAPYSAEDWFMDVMNGSVGWADVGILTPYRFYKKYGDKRLLEKYFNNIVEYAEFMIRRCGRAKGIYALYAKPLHLSKENKKYAVNSGQSYGEWAEPNDVKEITWLDFAEPHPEESMAYTAWMMSLMIDICTILDKKEFIPIFEEYANGVKKAYQELVTKDRFSLDTNRQAKLVRPLYLKLLTDDQNEYAKKRLIQAMDYYGWRLGTGFLSTPFILYVLSDIDPKYAYKLLENKKMPGWLYMAENDTGTIWEGWEGPNSQLGISSLNHYSKGAMVEWLFKGMCGINIVKENYFEIKPIICNDEKYAKAEYDSIYGTIKVSWEINKNMVEILLEIPSNTTANFIFNNENQILSTGKYSYKYEIKGGKYEKKDI